MLHFALLVPGWRCADRVAACWASVVGQRPGPYTWEAHFYDDGSDDGTWRAIAALPDDKRCTRYRAYDNAGAAFARARLLEHVTDPEAVCVLLDMDDELEPGALARVALEYLQHPETWATYGSWTAGAFRGPEPYPAGVAAARAYRRHPFRAQHLRTFRRHLADGVPASYLQDAGGRWLMAGTDVALMWTVLEQCPAERVRRIPDVLYRYTWRRPTGTVARFGAAYKATVRARLAALPPLPLKETHA